MADAFDVWMDAVKSALCSINMSLEDWQALWPFDFPAEFRAGNKAEQAALKANRFWWREQNRSLGQACSLTSACWLQNGHQDRCQPVSQGSPPSDRTIYEPGDYVKVEFPDETTGIGEWMWVHVTRCEHEKQLVFGILDSEPLNEYAGRIGLGTELAVRYSQIREHKKPTEFTKQ